MFQTRAGGSYLREVILSLVADYRAQDLRWQISWLAPPATPHCLTWCLSTSDALCTRSSRRLIVKPAAISRLVLDCDMTSDHRHMSRTTGSRISIRLQL